jgi:hypothetical protein
MAGEQSTPTSTPSAPSATRSPSPADMPQRRRADSATLAPSTPSILDGIENDLPECMRPGWDPMRPGREAERRFLDACYAEGVDPREVDPEGHFTGQF